MSDLNDLFKVIAEGKKDFETNDPKGKLLKEVKDSVKTDLSDIFTQLTSMKSELEQELVTLEAKREETLVEEVPPQETIQPEAIPTPEERAQGIQYDALKYLKGKSFQQPEPDIVSQDIDDVRAKIKFLEQAIGKIAATGPGSGEVNFRWLDDVNRSTMSNSNDNWVLEYDSTTGKVQFTEHIGPIRSIKYNTTGPQTPLVAGQTAWNAAEDCLDTKHADGSTLQHGYEHYFQIHNATGDTLLNGEVVMFAGVDEDDHTNPIPEVQRYVANETAIPLYIVGVMTNDVAAGEHGRATVFGKVRNLNTTGSSVGETWLKGDLLWANPDQPGKLTRVRPTAPDVATSVAAILQVGTTDGVLLVRPTIWPRLFFGDWYSTQPQTLTTINTPKRITMNESGFVSGFTNNNGLITAQNAGLYNFQFSLQVISTNSSAQYYWIWYRKNGVDAPNSATKLSISSNSIVLAPSWNFPVSMKIGDTFELMWAADSLNMSLAALPANTFHPAIPSVILTVQQTNL